MELETSNTFIKNSQIHGEFCPLDTTIKILSGRWKTIILNRLMKEELHFNELVRRIPNCTRRMLALQLKELIEAQIVDKKILTDKFPVQTCYTLTEQGKSLLPIVWSMNQWGEQYIKKIMQIDTLEPSCGD
ncbi:winged helix-turn-helix transcriptional regulator [Lactococcus nasutitermitis]|uniref:Winged helix-turn-helix transcriptional regulator n=1 Tax=Lactococcus nasutitermitis TaxID=1652957 RepID=A0ABV9JCG0_9LACT|nr:helix-turn-helix domain-containing protein [Lactococcus nasutitermitis]